jgi:hypothetical protein
MCRALAVAVLPLALLVVPFACRTAVQPQHVLVLDYEAFGPPVVAHELLGSDWWQWQSNGDPRPRKYPIKVAVYSGMTKQEVETRYPVVPEREQDFRYVTKQSALEYLDRTIVDAPIVSVRDRLVDTKKTILQTLK